ncbi:venom serine protease-like isoform X2 [Phymastichus coffea]|uniref:venom serine protease-like isoform X2 n=1 Tax=Phymastichus coffea TaxID=108790 RepID=UPI00273B3157|nr:venom serine protease-like isoform X2 [Phymastichus coffea]
MRNFVYYFVQIAGLSLHFSIAEPIRGENVVAVEEGEFPFVVALITNTNCDIICTGVLISERHVLTAAHCFEELQPNNTQVVLGSVDLTIGTRYNVGKWITYDEWAEIEGVPQSYDSTDIAIIKLCENVDNKVAKPAELSEKTRSEICLQNVTVLGWGQTNPDSNDRPRYLQKASLTVLTSERCEQIVSGLMNETITLDDSLFCTKHEPSSKLGDSGCPILTEKRKVVGIHIGICPKKSICFRIR